MLQAVRLRTVTLLVIGYILATPMIAALLLAAPAKAAVWNCNYGYSTVGAYAYCSSGNTAYFESHVLCQNRFTLASRVVNGPRQRVNGGKPSIISSCAWYERFYGQPWASSA